MNVRSQVQRYVDRISVSFADDAEDVDCIVTVTFDNRVTTDLTDSQITEMARQKLRGAVDGETK